MLKPSILKYWLTAQQALGSVQAQSRRKAQEPTRYAKRTAAGLQSSASLERNGAGTAISASRSDRTFYAGWGLGQLSRDRRAIVSPALTFCRCRGQPTGGPRTQQRLSGHAPGSNATGPLGTPLPSDRSSRNPGRYRYPISKRPVPAI